MLEKVIEIIQEQLNLEGVAITEDSRMIWELTLWTFSNWLWQ